MTSQKKTKILIIRFSAIGDIIWTTPVLRVLQEQLPEVELHYCVKAQYQSLLRHNPHVDTLHLYEGNLKELKMRLKKENFDYIIDLHANLRSSYLKFFLNKKSFTYNKRRAARWLLVNFKINFFKGRHVADWFLETLAPLGVKPDEKGLEFYLSESEQVSRVELPVTHRDVYVAVVIGATRLTKRLPFEKLVELCQRINQPIVLIGGKEDTPTGQQLIERFQDTVPLYNACGKYSLNQSISLVKGAQVVFGHDTGLMHVAAAFQKKVYAIYGSTTPEMVYPYRTEYVLIENESLSCRPCSKHGRDKCPQGHFKCLREVHFDLELESDLSFNKSKD